MGILLAFAAGYVLGARGGSEDFDDVVQAIQAIRRSDEFADLVKSLRSHTAHTLRELAALLERVGVEGEGGQSVTTQDLVDRVKTLIGRE
jgi:hypothetical protein